MTTTIVTCCWGTAWERYGAAFVEGAKKFWPDDWRLIFISDEPRPLWSAATILQLGQIEGVSDFYTRHIHNKEVCGLAPNENWKEKDRALGYSWRHDAMKWMPQGVSMMAAAQRVKDGDLLIWLDADVMTLKAPPSKFFETLFSHHEGAYLGREPKHSEIGFWGVRMNPLTRSFCDTFALLYLEDTFLDLRQTHSAFVWDHARSLSGVKLRNLTPGGKGNVFPRTELGRYFYHYKGPRKTRIVQPA